MRNSLAASVVKMVVLCLVAAPPCAVAADSAPVHGSVAPRDGILRLDTHLDVPARFVDPQWDFMQRHLVNVDGSQVDYPRMVQGGLDGGFFAIFTPQGPRTPEGNAAARDAALQRALAIREVVAAHPDRLALARTADDAARIKLSGRRAVYMSIENAYPVEQDLTLLATFNTLGVTLLGLVHFTNNDLADSSTDPKGPEWHGLSPLGRRAVDEANRLGLVLDASHASDDVLDQLLDFSRAPIILSHSGCKAVFDNPRNIDDARLQRLAASGGVIQINSLGAYLAPLTQSPARVSAQDALEKSFGGEGARSPEQERAWWRARAALDRRYPPAQASIDDFMRHLLHALSVAGPEHVGIGADWDGGGGVRGMQDVAQIGVITQRLRGAGYTTAQIADIWGGNALRVLRQAQAVAGFSDTYTRGEVHAERH